MPVLKTIGTVEVAVLAATAEGRDFLAELKLEAEAALVRGRARLASLDG